MDTAFAQFTSTKTNYLSGILAFPPQNPEFNATTNTPLKSF
jgi:hypothetical protein